MREIKFRFFDILTNDWCVDGRYEISIYDFAFKKGMAWTYLTKTEAMEIIIVSQFTGLKDKNGVDIYEGDIVNHFNELMTIVNRHGAFYHKHKTAEAYGNLHSIHYPFKPLENNEYYEVIGNIYQNHELLK